MVLPTDPARFNGTVLVEWRNVTGGQDTPANWMVAHREILRKGDGYMAVSAQKVGVEGGDTIMAAGGIALNKANPSNPVRTYFTGRPDRNIGHRIHQFSSWLKRSQGKTMISFLERRAKGGLKTGS